MADRHSYYLDELCKKDNLRDIGVDTGMIYSIMKEPIIYDSNGVQTTCCDVFVYSMRNHWDLIELKSQGKQDKARSQLQGGLDYIVEHFPIDSANLIYVSYHKREYNHKILDTYNRPQGGFFDD